MLSNKILEIHYVAARLHVGMRAPERNKRAQQHIQQGIFIASSLILWIASSLFNASDTFGCEVPLACVITVSRGIAFEPVARCAISSIRAAECNNRSPGVT